MKMIVALALVCSFASAALAQAPIPPAGPFPLPATGSFVLLASFGPVRPKINDPANAWVDVNVCGAVDEPGLRFAIDQWDGNRWVRIGTSPVLGVGYHYGSFLDIVISRTQRQIFRVLVIDAQGGVVGTPEQFDTSSLLPQMLGLPLLP
jgi:hypothetical protein